LHAPCSLKSPTSPSRGHLGSPQDVEAAGLGTLAQLVLDHSDLTVRGLLCERLEVVLPIGAWVGRRGLLPIERDAVQIAANEILLILTPGDAHRCEIQLLLMADAGPGDATRHNCVRFYQIMRCGPRP